MDSTKLLAMFKQHSIIVGWDIQSTARLFEIDFNPSPGTDPLAPSLVTKVQFDRLNSSYLLISGEADLERPSIMD